jgi:hypothetical protein
MNLTLRKLLFILPKLNFKCHTILRHGTSGFTSIKERLVADVIRLTLKNPSPRSGLNPQYLGSVTSTLTIIPPKRRGSPHSYIIWGINSSIVGGRSSETSSYSIDVNNNIDIVLIDSTVFCFMSTCIKL